MGYLNACRRRKGWRIGRGLESGLGRRGTGTAGKMGLGMEDAVRGGRIFGGGSEGRVRAGWNGTNLYFGSVVLTEK